MGSTGTQWSSTSGHLKVGVNVRYDDVTSSTTTSHTYGDFYVQSQSWAYSDNQRINFNYGLSGGWDYSLSTTNGSIQTIFLGTYDTGNKSTSYSGGPSLTYGAYISGAYDGSAPSIAYTFTLPARPATAPGVPGVSINTVTTSSAKVVISAAASNGDSIDTYSSQVSSNSGFSAIVDSWSSTGTRTVTGLAAATKYWVRSRAHNGVGWGSYSTVKTFTTGATVPGTTTGVSVTSITATSANMSWTAPSDGGSDIIEYDVQLSTASDYSANLISLTVEGTSTALLNLSPGTTYYRRVRAVNGVGNGAWSSSATFTTLTGLPTIQTPVSGSTVDKSWIDALLKIEGVRSDTTITVQYSQSSSFASGVLEVVRSASAVWSKLKDTYTVLEQGAGYYIKNGTWYVRAKVSTPSLSYTSAWTATTTITVSHVPSAITKTPAPGGTSKWTTITNFTWDFVDAAKNPDVGAGDNQSAFQIVLERVDTGAVVTDTGKQIVTAQNYGIAINPSLKGVQLRWKVRVWDKGDTASTYTGYATFRVVDPPVVTFVTPVSGSPVDNGSPLFSWTFSAPSGGTQTAADLVVKDTETNEVVYEKAVVGAGLSIQPNAVILLNTHNYLATLTVSDSFGITGETSINFSAAYVSPDPVAYYIDASGANELGYVRVDWNDAIPDNEFVMWKIYRRADIVGSWELVTSYTDQNVREHRDFMVTSGVTYLWSVTQVANRSGALLESPVGYYMAALPGGGTDATIESRAYYMDLTYYWIINPDNTSLSVRLKSVISDDSTLEFEQASYNIIGRGRHVDYGDEQGYSGTLVCQLRQADRVNPFRLAIETLRREQETCILRTPFGRTFQVALGNLGWSPLAGTGTSEMGDLTIPYMEVE